MIKSSEHSSKQSIQKVLWHFQHENKPKHPTGLFALSHVYFTTLMIKLSVCEGNVKDDDFRLSKLNAALKCSVVELPVGA